MIRIFSGRLKGRRICTLKGVDTRPTLAKTRDAIFNVLSSRYILSDFEACDLFAGSGALGFEAYSRGVERVVLVDHDRRAISLLQKNIAQLSLPNAFQLVNKDAVQWVRNRSWRNSPVLFLIDPPYRTELAAKIVEAIDNQSHNLAGSLLVVETSKNHPVELPSRFSLFRQKYFGETRVDFVKIEKAILHI